MADNKTTITLTAVDQASDVLSKVGGNVLSLGKAADLVKGQIGAIGAGISLAGFAALIGETVKAAQGLHDLSLQTGATVESLSGIGSVAKLSGTGMDQISLGLQKMVKSMEAAKRGSIEQSAVFNALGVSVTNASGQLRDSGSVMQDVAKSIESIQSPTERVAAAQLVFGKSGAQLLPVLKDLATTGDLVVKTTTAQANMADEISKNFTRLGVVYSSTGRILAMEFLPTIDTFVETMLKSATASDGVKGSIKELAADGTLREFAETTGKAIGFLVDSLEGLGRFVVLTGKAYGAAAAAMAAPNNAKAIWDEFATDFQKYSTSDLFSKRLAAAMDDPWRGWTEQQKTYAQNAAKVAAAYAAYPLEVQQKAMLALATNSFGLDKKPFTMPTAGADESKRAYESLIASIREKTDALNVEAATEGKLTEAQKLTLKIMTDLRDGRLKLTDTEKRALAQDLERLGIADQLNESRKAQVKAAAELQAYSAKQIDDLDKSIAAQHLHNAEIGQSAEVKELAKKASFDLVTQQLAEDAANLRSAASVAAMSKEYRDMYLSRAEAIDREIQKRGQLSGMMSEAAALEAQQVAIKEQADAWKSVEGVAHTTWGNIEKDGIGSIRRLGDTIKSAIWDMLYQISIKKWLINIVTSVAGGGVATAAFGANAVNGAANGLSLGSSLSNLGSFTGLGSSSLAVGSAGTGLYGSLATSSLGQWAGLSSTSLGATGADAAMTSLGASVGTALPYIGAALAAISVISSLIGKGGGPKTEGGWGGQIGATGSLYNASSVGNFGLAYTGHSADATAAQMVAPIGTAIQQLIKSIGGNASGIGLQLGYSSDPSGSAPDMVTARIQSAAGQTAYTNSYDTARGGASDALKLEAERMTLASVKAATGIDKIFTDIVDSIDLTTASAAQMDAVMSKLSDTMVLRDEFKALGWDVSKLTTTLIDAAGGTAALQSGLQAYYDNFYSEEEKKAAATKTLQGSFTALGMEMPKTREEFRSMVTAASNDLTDTGKSTFAALLGLSSAFAAVTDATTTAAAAAAEAARLQAGRQSWQDKLDLLTGSRTQRELDLAAVTDEATKALMRQVYAQQDLQASADAKATLKDSFSDPLTAATAASKIAETMGIGMSSLLGKSATEIRAFFRSLAESFDPATEAGRAAIAAMGSLSGAIGVLVNAADAAAQNLAQAISSASAAQTSIAATYALPMTVSDATSAIRGANVGIDAGALSGATSDQIKTLIGNAVKALDPTKVADQDTIARLQSLGSAFNTLISDADNRAQAAAQAEAAAAQAAAQAAAEAQRAADEQARAQQAIREGWQRTADSIVETMKKLRGDILTGPASFAAAQANFTIASAQAQAGDQNAANSLPALAQAMVDLGKNNSGSSIEQALLTARTIASLNATLQLMSRFGVTVPAFDVGTNVVPQDMLAQIHQGERIIPAADNRALMTAIAQGGDMSGELRALRAEVAALRADNSAENRAIAKATGSTAQTLIRVVPDGDAFAVRTAT